MVENTQERRIIPDKEDKEIINMRQNISKTIRL